MNKKNWHKILLKGFGGGVLFCIVIYSYFLLSKTNQNTSLSLEDIKSLTTSNIDNSAAASQIVTWEKNKNGKSFSSFSTISNYSKSSSSYYSKNSSSKNFSSQNIEIITPINTSSNHQTQTDDEIINNILNNQNSSFSFQNISSQNSSFSNSQSSSASYIQTNGDFLKNIVQFDGVNISNQQNFLDSINTILSRFDSLKNILNGITIKWDSSEKRGYATHSFIVINAYNLGGKEFWEVFTHELGHIMDLGYITGNGEKSSQFTEFGQIVFAKNDPSLKFYSLSRDGEKIRKSGAKSQDFVSGYGMSDPFEDYAECFNMYINHKNAFLAMTKSSQILKQKYDILDSYFSGKYFFVDDENAKKIESSPFWRPWDSTKMK